MPVICFDAKPSIEAGRIAEMEMVGDGMQHGRPMHSFSFPPAQSNNQIPTSQAFSHEQSSLHSLKKKPTTNWATSRLTYSASNSVHGALLARCVPMHA